MAQKDKGQKLLYHGAFRLLREHTRSHKASAKLRASIGKSNIAKDILHTIGYKCLVETDWIKAIEEGLPHIDAAIREDRQFIRQEGEILPIEKAKRVSRVSVEHLSKHSNLITRLPEEGERLIPDKLYVVENLSNYAIYENRFLYMVLRYINDFLVLHLDEIEKVWCRYVAELKFEKTAVLGQRSLSCRLEFREQGKLDETLYDEAVVRAIERIRSCLHFVSVLLATPLMQELAKVPLLSPPITKTNILRMNVHFKAAAQLYEYLSSYSGKGYTVEEIKTSAAPFSEQTADEIAELVLLSSYLTYAHGGYAEELEAAYREEQEEERRLAIQAAQKELLALKERIQKHGADPESYMLLLEQQNARLFADSEALLALRKTHEELEAAYASTTAEFEATKDSLSSLQKQANLMQEDLLTARKASLKEIEKLKADLAEKENSLHSVTTSENVPPTPPPEKQEEEKDEEDKLSDVILAKDGTADYKEMYYLLKARYDAVRHQKGLLRPTPELATRESIEELEQEFEAFKRLFDSAWREAKRKIRKEYLWSRQKKKEAAPKEKDSKDDRQDKPE